MMEESTTGLVRKNYTWPRKPGIISKCFENKTNFLIFIGILTNFNKYVRQKSANFVRIGFCNGKFQKLRPIFATARINIFGKMVTLGWS